MNYLDVLLEVSTSRLACHLHAPQQRKSNHTRNSKFHGRPPSWAGGPQLGGKYNSVQISAGSGSAVGAPLLAGFEKWVGTRSVPHAVDWPPSSECAGATTNCEKAPFLAKNARNGAPSLFMISEKWVTRSMRPWYEPWLRESSRCQH